MRKFLIYMLAIITLGSSVSVAPLTVSAAGIEIRPVERHYAPRGYYRGDRGYYRGNRGYYYGNRGYYARDRYYDRRYYRRHRHNDAIGAGIAGLAVGALVGGALVNQNTYYRGGNRDAYCYSRYRSYDARTGTYVGYDGRRHYCR
jgi:hypothetical protein